MRHLITLDDISAEEASRIFAITEDLKAKFAQGIREPLLPGRMMALLFEKQSLRTRVSFEAGMAHMGGRSMMLGDEAGFGSRESVADFARVLGSMVDVIVARCKRHSTVQQLAAHAGCPLINGLTDEAHPCQALADLYTLREKRGDLAGLTLAWVGDGNNVAKSLARGCSKFGMRLVVCTPPGYELDSGFCDRLRQTSGHVNLEQTHDPQVAVRDADAVYTDVWASMGQEGDRERRKRDFLAFQVNRALMSAAPPDALFLHCLPARRGEEVTDEVLDGPQSAVLQQAGNRMHVQKGVLAWLLGAHPA